MSCSSILDGATVVVWPLPCLGPVQHNPEGLRVERAGQAWARRCLGDVVGAGLEAALERRSPSWLVPSYPAASGDRLLKLWKLDQMYFLLDDDCITGTASAAGTAAQCTRLVEHLRGRTAPTVPVDEFLIDLVRDLTDDMSAGLRARALEGMAIMLTAFVEEMAHLRDGAAVDWDTAMEIRFRSAGAAAYLPWTEYALGVDMTVPLDRYPVLATISRLVGKQLTLVNELCSWRKEHFAGDHTNPVCMMLSTGASLQEAFDLVAGHAAQAERDIVSLCDVALAGEPGRDRDVVSYLTALEQLVAGATHWQYNAVRYHGPGFRCSPAARSTWLMYADRTELVDTTSTAEVIDAGCRCAAREPERLVS